MASCICPTRNASAGQAGGGGDAGDQPEGHARGGERQGLLAAASEDERITSLEAQDAKPLAGAPDQALGDVGLLRGRLAAALAGVFEGRASRAWAMISGETRAS